MDIVSPHGSNDSLKLAKWTLCLLMAAMIH